MLNDFYHSLNPVAFSVGPLEVRWYGLAYIAGFVAAGFIVYWVMKRWRKPFALEDLLTVVCCCAFGIIIGARLGYCLFYGAGYYGQHPLKIFALTDGGMSFHGGLIGIVIAGIIAARLVKISTLTMIDLGSIAAPAGLFFGRCANFVNGELWGAPTDVPWGVIFDLTGGGSMPRHPSQLYEACLEGIVILVVLLLLAHKNNPPRYRGTFFGAFMTLYGVFRIAIEFVRQPDAQIGYLFGTSWITEGMCLSVPMVIVGLFFLIYVAGKLKLPQQGRLQTN